MGGIKWFEDWDWAGYIELLAARGCSADAIALAQSSTERDPLSELLAGGYSDALYFARRFEEALAPH